MASAPGSNLLPPDERQLFVEQFDKDVKFFQLFYLIVNRACPIKNVDLIWTEAGQFRHLGITEAVQGPYSRLFGDTGDNPHPKFCNIINDYGRCEAQTCSQSDRAAADRAGLSGRTEVYRCDFGLTDIAVPVMWNGAHIATLCTGQVLREPPSGAAFRQIETKVAHLPHVDIDELEKAYWGTSVVSEADIQNAVAILESFAEYLSNSWTRISEAVKQRKRRDRERELLAKEYAYLLLQGGVGAHSLREVAGRLGISRHPNRVLVAAPGSAHAETASYDIALTGAIGAVEEVCEDMPNVTSAYLRGRGICVFFDDRDARNPAGGDFNALRLARKITNAIDGGLRVGIGGAKSDWRDLADSCAEARAALAGSADPVVLYRASASPLQELTATADAVAAALERQDISAARAEASRLSAMALSNGAFDLPAQRIAYFTVLDKLASVAEKLGVDTDVLSPVRDLLSSKLNVAATDLELQEVYLSAAGAVIDEVGRHYAGRTQKIVQRVCRIVDQSLASVSPAVPSVRDIAAAVGVSVSHLSRVFHRETGETLEAYLIRQRIDRAKRLLLDPGRSVAQVAEACGFTDANYFSRAFRKQTGCSARDYRLDPTRVQQSPKQSTI